MIDKGSVIITNTSIDYCMPNMPQGVKGIVVNKIGPNPWWYLVHFDDRLVWVATSNIGEL